MNRRMVVALLCLAGIFISAYLWMFKLGLLGTLACGTGGCETVQLSPQSRFLGIEVALIGLVGYVVLFGLAMASLQPGLAAARWPVQLLAALSGGAVLFTGYLKFLEFFVIHAICRWCVASAVIIATVFVLSVLEARALPRKA
ncbi:MAG: Vitamin epoxide reductase [Gemmatimonadetes bacterium]|nr:Vitamin epoxide reductase [Gemmatimonadota bacterium]